MRIENLSDQERLYNNLLKMRKEIENLKRLDHSYDAWVEMKLVDIDRRLHQLSREMGKEKYLSKGEV